MNLPDTSAGPAFSDDSFERIFSERFPGQLCRMAFPDSFAERRAALTAAVRDRCCPDRLPMPTGSDRTVPAEQFRPVPQVPIASRRPPPGSDRFRQISQIRPRSGPFPRFRHQARFRPGSGPVPPRFRPVPPALPDRLLPDSEEEGPQQAAGRRGKARPVRKG